MRQLPGEPRGIIAVANRLLLTDDDDANWELPPDPALESWANFTVWVPTGFIGPAGLPADEDAERTYAGNRLNGYDGSTHRYDPAYVRPGPYELRLDASLGMQLNRPEPVARWVGVDPHPQTLRDFTDVIDGDGRGPWVEPDENGPMVPETVAALGWLIRRSDGSWSSRWLNMRPRPVAPMQNASFMVPSVGAYDVTLRVHFTNGSIAERTVRIELRDWFIASIGDSFAAGQGNPDVGGSLGVGPTGAVNKMKCDLTTLSAMLDRIPGIDSTPSMSRPSVWTEPLFYRSMRSGPAKAARALRREGGSTRTRDGRQVDPITLDRIVFVSLARSGAEVRSGLLNPQDGEGDVIGTGQIDELERTAAGRRIDALMISIGGNDAGFSGVLSDLVLHDTFWHGGDAAARDVVRQRIDEFIATDLPGIYDELRDRISLLREAVGVRDIYWSGYPTGLFDTRGKGGEPGFDACEVFAGPDLDIDRADYEAIRTGGARINALIERKAQEFGWQFVPIDEDFLGRGYCESGDYRYWVRMGDSCRRQGDWEGTMHPNEEGHAAYGRRMYMAMSRHTFNLRDPAPDVMRPDPVGVRIKGRRLWRRGLGGTDHGPAVITTDGRDERLLAVDDDDVRTFDSATIERFRHTLPEADLARLLAAMQGPVAPAAIEEE